MKLYDFAFFARKRDELRSAKQVEELLPRLNEPGAVIELKQRVDAWLILHQNVLLKAS